MRKTNIAVKANRVIAKPATKSTAKAVASKLGAATAKLGKNTGEPVANAKPDAAAKPAATSSLSSERAAAHAAAGAAVAAFYSGASLPFKAAGDTFKPLNFDNAKAATERQAALMLALLTYGAANVKPNGEFVRGGFIVPAKLVFSADTMRERGIEPSSMLRAQPESGCLGNMLGRTVDYVSGPKAGAGQREQILRFRPAAVRAEIAAALGDKHAKLADAIFSKRS